jgi:hypothetical protein
VPLTAHGVNDATDDPATITAWWTRWPDANVALACGGKSGVYVVDVDVDTEKGVDGWESLKAFPEMPATVKQLSPRGGAHFFFKTDNPPRNKNNFRNGIDIRAEGYYVMLTPSVSVQPQFEADYPDGIAYEWEAGFSPDDVELAEFPEHFRPENEKVRLPWELPKAEKPIVAEKRAEKPQGASVLERASLYLQQCSPAVQGQGGHDALLWAARCLITGFCLTRTEALDLLWADFNPRCVPQWDRSSPSDAKDFERKVDQAMNTACTKPNGWLLNEFNPVDDADGKLLAMGLESAALLLEPKVVAEEETMPERDPDSRWTDDMFKIGGYVGELMRYIEANNPRTQKKLAMIAALSGAGTLFGRKVRTVDNARTNIYAFGIGPTSCGKDAPGSMVLELFRHAGANNLIGASRVTSDSAIEMELEEHPVRLYCWDEVGEFLGSMKQAGVGSGNASHLSTIKPLLKEIWSRAGKTHEGKRRVEGRRSFIQPHICLYGSATPDQFMAGLNSKDVSGGLVPRCLIAFTKEIPDLNIRYADPPESLIQITEAWYHRQILPTESSGDIKDVMMPHQIIVPETEAARMEWLEFAARCTGEMRKCDAAGDSWSGMWGKAAENTRRVALILACSDNYEKPEISQGHMSLARQIVTACVEDTIDVIRECMSDSQAESDRQYVFKAIKIAGRKGIERSALTGKTGKINKTIRNGCIEELVDAGQVDMFMHPSKKKIWLWLSPYGIAAVGAVGEGGASEV